MSLASFCSLLFGCNAKFSKGENIRLKFNFEVMFGKVHRFWKQFRWKKSWADKFLGGQYYRLLERCLAKMFSLLSSYTLTKSSRCQILDKKFHWSKLFGTKPRIQHYCPLTFCPIRYQGWAVRHVWFAIVQFNEFILNHKPLTINHCYTPEIPENKTEHK